jgi:cation diffusion facilitator CzcD-associated flavoprotein CzcO
MLLCCPSSPLSPEVHRYADLRTNLPREIMGFSDFPFVVQQTSKDRRQFCGHEEVSRPLSQGEPRDCLSGAANLGCDGIRWPAQGIGGCTGCAQVAAYLEAFAEEFDLRQFIRFRTKVTGLVPLPSRNDETPREPAEWGPRWRLTAAPVGDDGMTHEVQSSDWRSGCVTWLHLVSRTILA